MRHTPLNCCKCGRFIGKDGYPDIVWDSWNGGWEEGYSYCGPCGREKGYPDKRQIVKSKESFERGETMTFQEFKEALK